MSALSRKSQAPARGIRINKAASIGNVLMLRFALPLEIVGVLLTVALIGAVTLAMHEKQEKQ